MYTVHTISSQATDCYGCIALHARPLNICCTVSRREYLCSELNLSITWQRYWTGTYFWILESVYSHLKKKKREKKSLRLYENIQPLAPRVSNRPSPQRHTHRRTVRNSYSCVQCFAHLHFGGDNYRSRFMLIHEFESQQNCSSEILREKPRHTLHNTTAQESALI